MITLGMDLDDMKEALAVQSQRLAKYRSTVPDGVNAPWKVRTITVEFDLGLLRMVRDGRGCAPGKYKQLVHDTRGIVMSDTDAEISDFLPFVRAAKGHVVVAGLGLGLVTQALLESKAVKTVTVVEIDRHVIELVGPHMKGDRLLIEHADANKWRTRRTFDFAWLDIWDDICGDNCTEMRRMKRSFKKFANKVSAWREDEMESRA